MLSCASSKSYSSSMSPTICSSTSSMVTRPATPPYSLTTIAMWLRETRNSRSSTLRRFDSGMKTAGRSQSRSSKCSSVCRRSRSLASRMPRMLSRSPSMTGKREWAASMISGRVSSSGSSMSMTSIWARGTITSVTRVSEAASAPSMMVSASASIRLRS
ncbi:hypothetical protein SDC9_178389 [bioreactor metagenome]|uniref:Uncharacterized protein n=1 Tax=bioreactor metagenome TaxID=1076179 RepID=A0A645GVS4_9ZZZZ